MIYIAILAAFVVGFFAGSFAMRAYIAETKRFERLIDEIAERNGNWPR
ncbi:TPA: hypothetical protein I8W54_004200 [Morganella morganii]|nr:hypothetical protein [Morganella morganii]